MATKAMFRHDVVIEGDVELMRLLKGFSKGFKEKALLYAVKRGGEVIKREAQARAPRRTGNLRRSIMVDQLKSTKKLAKVGISWRVKDGVSGLGQASRNPAFYGIMVEKGTRPRFRKSYLGVPLSTGPASTGTMPARPFLEPAYDSKRGQASKEIKKELSMIIKKAVKKGLRSG